MEFFNKKEDVIDLKLTQFGRHLLSRGKLNPVYYSFFDDNVLYNNTYSGTPIEEQNRSEERIREAQSMQPQIGLSSLEKEFGNSYELILSGDAQPGDTQLQRTPDKEYLLTEPIGTSDINSEYAPSWSVQFLNGALSSSAEYINLKEKNGGSYILPVPQLETDLEIKMPDFGVEDDMEEYEGEPFSGLYEDGEDSSELYVLLKVTENNGLFQKKNFDIEIFEIQEEYQGSTKIETLKPLYFPIQHQHTTELDFIDIVTPSENKNYAEYYFDILVDDEIDDDILCEFDPVNQSMGVYADPRTKLCQDIINEQKKKSFNIYDDEADSPGEIC